MLERSGDSFFLGPGRQQNTMRAAALNAQMTSRPLKENWRPHRYTNLTPANTAAANAFAIRLNDYTVD